jgi:hypothetical protein
MNARIAMVRVVLFSGCCLGVIGCGDSGPKFGEAKGKVTFEGKPLTAGLLVFTNPSDTLMGSTYVAPDGTFHAKQVPAGDVVVAIKTEEFRNQIDAKTIAALQKKGVPIVMPETPDKGTKYMPIPDKYADPKLSGLKFDIQHSGVTEIEIKLTK